MVPNETGHRPQVVGNFLLAPKSSEDMLSFMPLHHQKGKENKNIHTNCDCVPGRKHIRLACRKGALVFSRSSLSFQYERHWLSYKLQYQQSSCDHLKCTVQPGKPHSDPQLGTIHILGNWSGPSYSLTGL